MLACFIYFIENPNMKVFWAIVVLAAWVCQCALSSNQVCKCGWTYYKGHCYLYSTKTASWYMAASICRAEDGYLVKVGSKSENDFLKGYARLFSQKHSHAKNRGFWIGLSDTQSEGKWRWDVDNKAMSFRDFGRGQPDNHKNKEDCGQLWTQSQGFRWNDLNCHVRIHYICEADVFNKKSCTCKA